MALIHEPLNLIVGHALAHCWHSTSHLAAVQSTQAGPRTQKGELGKCGVCACGWRFFFLGGGPAARFVAECCPRPRVVLPSPALQIRSTKESKMYSPGALSAARPEYKASGTANIEDAILLWNCPARESACAARLCSLKDYGEPRGEVTRGEEQNCIDCRRNNSNFPAVNSSQIDNARNVGFLLVQLFIYPCNHFISLLLLDLDVIGLQNSIPAVLRESQFILERQVTISTFILSTHFSAVAC